MEMSSRKLFISPESLFCSGFYAEVFACGFFSPPDLLSKPFHSSSLFDQSQFSEANGVSSLQVSGDFTSLSSLLNLLRKFLVLKTVFRAPLSTALATAQPWDCTGLTGHARTWGSSTSLPSPARVCFALRAVQQQAPQQSFLPTAARCTSALNGKASSSQERVKPSEALGSFAGERAALLFVLKHWQESGEERIT